MKKLVSVLSFSVLGAAIMFTSCKKDEDVTAPDISFEGINSTITNDTLKLTAADNGSATASFTISVDASGEIETGKLEITHGNSTNTDAGFATAADAASGETNLEYDVEDVLTVGIHKYKVTITDNAETPNTVSKELVVVVSSSVIVGGEITTKDVVLLGAQGNNTLGSYYGTATQTVYKQTEAGQHQADVDFIYFYKADGTTLAEIISPLYGGTDGNLTNVEAWDIKNATKFKLTTVTVSEFDAITDDIAIKAQGTNVTETKIGALTKDKVFAFQTAAGKLGLAKVKELTAGTDGTITLTVKVQK